MSICCVECFGCVRFVMKCLVIVSGLVECWGGWRKGVSIRWVGIRSGRCCGVGGWVGVVRVVGVNVGAVTFCGGRVKSFWLNFARVRANLQKNFKK